MRASARELLVPFLTPLVWCSPDLNSQPTAPKADILPTGLSRLCLLIKKNMVFVKVPVLHMGGSEGGGGTGGPDPPEKSQKYRVS